MGREAQARVSASYVVTTAKVLVAERVDDSGRDSHLCHVVVSVGVVSFMQLEHMTSRFRYKAQREWA